MFSAEEKEKIDKFLKTDRGLSCHRMFTHQKTEERDKEESVKNEKRPEWNNNTLIPETTPECTWPTGSELSAYCRCKNCELHELAAQKRFDMMKTQLYNIKTVEELDNWSEKYEQFLSELFKTLIQVIRHGYVVKKLYVATNAINALGKFKKGIKSEK